MTEKNRRPGRAGELLPLLLGESLWMIRGGALPRLLEFARNATSGDARTPLAFFDDAPLFEEEEPEATGPGVRTITLTGVLMPHGFSSFFFGSSRGVQGFRDQLADAVADPNVVGIVLDVDSPGGSVGLVPEAAADVRAAREVKPVVAVANTLAASGAYYIASQASELYVTPSGDVGSIGVYYVHADYSRANDRVGVQVTYISAGKYKTEGNPDEPLSDDAREAWQADAESLYDMFVKDVALGRGVTEDAVRNGFGEGRTLLAQNALDAGMVDGVDTLQNVRDKLLADAASSLASGGASARRLGRAAGGFTPLAAAGGITPRVETPADDDEPAPDPAPEGEPGPGTTEGEPAPEPTPEPEPEPVAGGEPDDDTGDGDGEPAGQDQEVADLLI